MQLRLILRVMAFGLLAYLAILPAVIVVSMIMANVRAIPLGVSSVVGPVLYLGLRFGLFGVVGHVVAKGVADRKIANAALAGVYLAVAVLVLDSLLFSRLRRGDAVPHMPVDRPYMEYVAWIGFTLAWLGLQIGLAALGGWIAARGRPTYSAGMTEQDTDS